MWSSANMSNICLCNFPLCVKQDSGIHQSSLILHSHSILKYFRLKWGLIYVKITAQALENFLFNNITYHNIFWDDMLSLKSIYHDRPNHHTLNLLLQSNFSGIFHSTLCHTFIIQFICVINMTFGNFPFSFIQFT